MLVNRLITVFVGLYACIGAVVAALLARTDGLSWELTLHTLIYVLLPATGVWLVWRQKNVGFGLLCLIYLGLILRPASGFAGMGIHPPITISLPLFLPGNPVYLIDLFASLMAAICARAWWQKKTSGTSQVRQ